MTKIIHRCLLLAIVLLPLLATAVSCVETISLDPGEDRQVVVNCILREDDTQALELYYTSGTSVEDCEPIEDAIVTLSAYDEPVAMFTHDEGKLWKADYRPQYGVTYKLKVIIGEKTLTAETRFPDNVEVACYGRGRKGMIGRFPINFIFYSYELRTYQRDIPGNPRHGYPYMNACHLWIFPRNLRRGNLERYIGTTHACADNFNLTSIFVRDLVCFSRTSIFEMRQDVRKQLAWYPDKYPDMQLHDGFVRIDIPLGYENGKTQEELSNTPVYSPRAFVLVREFPVEYDINAWDRPYTLQLYDVYFLSDEADFYYKDIYRRSFNKDNFLFEYDTDNIYTNIEGGLGVFGAITLRVNELGVRGYLDDFTIPKE